MDGAVWEGEWAGKERWNLVEPQSHLFSVTPDFSEEQFCIFKKCLSEL